MDAGCETTEDGSQSTKNRRRKTEKRRISNIEQGMLNKKEDGGWMAEKRRISNIDQGILNDELLRAEIRRSGD